MIFVESSVAKNEIRITNTMKYLAMTYFPIPFDIEIPKNIDKFHDR